jgi:hypothetical protein
LFKRDLFLVYNGFFISKPLILFKAIKCIMAGEKSVTEKIAKIKEAGFVDEFNLVYDAFGEGLEPHYYWILDWMRDRMGYEVDKVADFFSASEASGYFGELGQRRTLMEKRGMELLQTIGAIVKSVIQLLWDLKEFELRLGHYEKLKSKDANIREAAENSLKGIWMTEVDVKKGPSSLNALAQNLNFVTIRDAFMVANKVSDIDDIDLNERVKRILKGKVLDYLEWKKESEKELRKRYKIERAYLKNQVDAIKLYTRWARPYLLATKKLLMVEGLAGEADMVTAFDVARIDILLFGKRIATKSDLEKGFPVPCVEVELRFRSSPATIQQKGAGHFTHRGRVDMYFRGYVFTQEQLDELEKLQEDEVLQFIEGMTKESLEALHEDLEKYLEEGEVKEEKKEVEIPIFSNIKKAFEGIREGGERFRGSVAKTAAAFGIRPREGPSSFEYQKKLASAKAAAKDDAWDLFDKFKKARIMIRW